MVNGWVAINGKRIPSSKTFFFLNNNDNNNNNTFTRNSLVGKALAADDDIQ